MLLHKPSKSPLALGYNPPISRLDRNTWDITADCLGVRLCARVPKLERRVGCRR